MKSKILRSIILVALALIMALSLASCMVEAEEAPEIDKTVKKLELNYGMTYCGMSLKDLSPLFDEQETSDPFDVNATVPSSYLLPFDFDNDGDKDDDDYNAEFEITIDFEVKKHIDSVYLYYKGTGQSITLETGTPFKYEKSVTHTVTAQGWNKVEINDDTQCLNIKFKNGRNQPPYEILVYGYDLGETPVLPSDTHVNKTMGYLVGINGHCHIDKSVYLECAGYFRDYKTWTSGYSKASYPAPGTRFNDFSIMKTIYSILAAKNTESVPCFMFDLHNTPVHLEGSDKNDPQSYVMYAEFVHQYTLKFGNNPANTLDMVKIVKGQRPELNLNMVKWIEIGNEPNGEDATGYTPYQLAAFTSASYDGHCGTMTAPSGSGLGIHTADPNVKVAMSGLAGIQNRYVKAMCFWLKHNRTDGEIGMDAFNVHTYCRKTIEYNGYAIEVGVSPEAGDLAGSLSEIVTFRDKYYPDKEVWLTEFGWDTNQSYLTQGSAHAYGPYTGRQVQAMWLTRAYFILASIGVDRAAMYMSRDVGAEETSIGKYGTSGVVTSNGSEKKDSYYYIYTIKNTMNDMYFVETIDSGNDDVWIYRFENGAGKSCYAMWCPTTDNVRVDGYELNVGNAKTITLTEMAYGETSGISTALTAKDGKVKVNVSECPILVFTEGVVDDNPIIPIIIAIVSGILVIAVALGVVAFLRKKGATKDGESSAEQAPSNEANEVEPEVQAENESEQTENAVEGEQSDAVNEQAVSEDEAKPENDNKDDEGEAPSEV